MIKRDKEAEKIAIESILYDVGNDASTLDIMRSVIGQKAILLDFKKPDPNNMLEIEESEKIESDANLFKKYDLGLQNSFAVGSVFSEATELYENAIKFEFRGKETSLSFTEALNYYSENEDLCCDLTMLMNISSKDRLHISTIDNARIRKKEKKFEDLFVNYEEKIDKYDEENALRYAEYFSDRIPEIKEEKYSFKYKLNNQEKDFLSEIYAEYNFPFTLSFKFGVMCISFEFELNQDYESNIEKIYYYIDCMLKIMEEFMN